MKNEYVFQEEKKKNRQVKKIFHLVCMDLSLRSRETQCQIFRQRKINMSPRTKISDSKGKKLLGWVLYQHSVCERNVLKSLSTPQVVGTGGRDRLEIKETDFHRKTYHRLIGRWNGAMEHYTRFVVNSLVRGLINNYEGCRSHVWKVLFCITMWLSRWRRTVTSRLERKIASSYSSYE